ncbi:hypothetical protein TNCV_1968551 [Trichonephila clavipes]|nr:hypothetical protein TNCV_1968551 [Trichonephila clavipes]
MCNYSPTNRAPISKKGPKGIFYASVPDAVKHFRDDIGIFIFQLRGVPQHWSANVRDYLNEHLSPSPMDSTSRGQQHTTYPMATQKS